MALSMSVGSRKNRLLLRGNVWPKLMAATAADTGLKQRGVAQSTIRSSPMVAGVMAFGVALMTR